MAQGDTPITVVGNLVADPELRYTPSGAAVANFRVASTPRQFDSQTNQWVDGETLFLTVNVWKQAAENVASSLSKGDRVIVSGRLRQRRFTGRTTGEQRTVIEVEADEVGPSLRYATAQVTRLRGASHSTVPAKGASVDTQQQRSAEGNPGRGGQGGFAGRNAGDPGKPAEIRHRSHDTDPWGAGNDADSEPPF